MPTKIFQVDAFASAPFRGNPAGVCILEAPATDEWMQSVAREMMGSATAFVRRQDGSPRIRWFTPNSELELCGHATLAAAHVLWQNGYAPRSEPIAFRAGEQRLVCRRSDLGIAMDFPAMQPEPVPPDGRLLPALGVDEIRSAGKSRMDLLVELRDEAAVRDLRPDLSLLAALPVRGVIATARGSGDFDFVSRFFAPAIGVSEDPVTGSAHCSLGPFWQARLGKSCFSAFQASHRGGTVDVTVRGDRVELRGNAVTVLHGELVC